MAEMPQMPQRIAQGFQSLSKLSEDSFGQLISTLEEMSPKLFPNQIINELLSKVDIPVDDVSAIVSTVMTLNTHRVLDDVTTEEIADRVLESAADANILVKDQEVFRNKLIRLFELNTLFVSAKALTILQSNENLFRDARIVTDVRPVFGSDTKAPPTAAVLVHMLDLSYLKDGNIQHLYIAMDSLDIDTLRETLNRAETKAKSLKPLIKGATILDPSE
jgi:hypothetical protein